MPMKRRAGVLAAIATTALVAAACRGTTDSGAGNNLPVTPGAGSHAPAGKLGVVAAENFWGDIARQIGGDTVQVTSIISDPNADPHQYESNARDGAAIAGASFVIQNGAGYDDFIAKLLAATPKSDREVLDVATVVGAGHDANPHLWYNPGYVRKAAQAIEAQLATEDPSHAAAYRANLTTFLQGEQQVVDVIDQIKSRYGGEAIAYTERVPGYLVDAAGLRLGIPASFSEAIENDSDPSPADIAAFDAALKDHKVKALLYNAQVTSPTTQRLKELAGSSGVAVVGVTETMPADAKNFQTWQADQARALFAALGG
jgi:zinc/manganese transport system substrate-binding protein